MYVAETECANEKVAFRMTLGIVLEGRSPMYHRSNDEEHRYL